MVSGFFGYERPHPWGNSPLPSPDCGGLAARPADVVRLLKRSSSENEKRDCASNGAAPFEAKSLLLNP
jgi:hypothetical protein